MAKRIIVEIQDRHGTLQCFGVSLGEMTPSREWMLTQIVQLTRNLFEVMGGDIKSFGKRDDVDAWLSGGKNDATK